VEVQFGADKNASAGFGVGISAFPPVPAPSKFSPMKDTQFCLGGSDQGFSAIDDIIGFLEEDIRGYLSEIQNEDPSALGLLITYLHILACVGENTKGYGQIDGFDFDEVRAIVLKIFDARLSVSGVEGRQLEDRTFIVSVFDRLKLLRDRHGPTLKIS
jgi:hypothetical protein